MLSDLASGCVGSGTSWEGLGEDQCQMLPLTGSVQPVWSYNVIHILWLFLLGLAVCVEDQAAEQGWFLLTPDPGAGQHKFQSTLIFTSVFLHLPASY